MENSLPFQNSNLYNVDSRESKVGGQSKYLNFDINKIENKLGQYSLRSPSTAAYQSQKALREKNNQSSEVKSLFKQDYNENYNKNIVGQSRQSKSIEKPVNVKQQQKQQQTLQQPSSQQSKVSIQNQKQSNNKPISSYSRQFDFRKTNLTPALRSGYQNMQQNEYGQLESRQNYKALPPILENKDAKASQLPSRSSVLSDPDNRIVFLDNGQRITNPTNVRTPPPPMWGEEIEEDNYDPNEDFYNHERAQYEAMKRKGPSSKPSTKNKKLKKKVVYVYESDSEDEENQKNQNDDYYLPYNNQSSYSNAKQSKRQFSQDAQRLIKNNKDQPNQLIGNLRVANSYQCQRPQVPTSSLRVQAKSSNGVQQRKIRTGGFQMLPNIKNYQ